MVSRASVMALDVLEFGAHYAADDGLYLLGNSGFTFAKEVRRGAQFCRISLRKRCLCNALCGARSRRTSRLVAFGNHHRPGDWRRAVPPGHDGPAVPRPQSLSGPPISSAPQYAAVGKHANTFSLLSLGHHYPRSAVAFDPRF